MALFIALPLWQFLMRTRSNNPAVMGQTPSQEDHIVYLDQDSILLPTVPPPPYSVEDPNPVVLSARRPVAVLAIVEPVVTTEACDVQDRGGTNGAELLTSSDSRRTNITLKSGRKEWELSLKAVMSVVIFLLAIVGIAWLGSMAVAYTWPAKEVLAEDSSIEHAMKSIYESLLEASYPPRMTIPEPSPPSLSLKALSAERSSTTGTSTIRAP